MAEEHGDSKNTKRNFKDIGAIRHKIRDPVIKRSYLSVSLRKDGSLLATDLENEEVCIFNKNGKLVQSFKVCSLGIGILELSDGNLAVSHSGSVNVYTPHGVFVKEFVSNITPCGLAVNNKGQLFVVDGDLDKREVLVYSEDGDFQYSFRCERSDFGEIGYLVCICIGQDGLVYIGEHISNCVVIFQQDGKFVRKFGTNVLKSPPQSIATFEDGHIVVVSATTNKLFIFTPSGECVHEVEVGLSCPCGVVVDSKGFIFVANHCNNRIVML